MRKTEEIAEAMSIEIGGRLRQARFKAGISQEILAAHLGVTYQQVQKYETGQNRISVPSFIMACEFLGANPAKFFKPLDGDNAPALPLKVVRKIARLNARQRRALMAFLSAMFGDQ